MGPLIRVSSTVLRLKRRLKRHRLIWKGSVLGLLISWLKRGWKIAVNIILKNMLGRIWKVI